MKAAEHVTDFLVENPWWTHSRIRTALFLFYINPEIGWFWKLVPRPQISSSPDGMSPLNSSYISQLSRICGKPYGKVWETQNFRLTLEVKVICTHICYKNMYWMSSIRHCEHWKCIFHCAQDMKKHWFQKEGEGCCICGQTQGCFGIFNGRVCYKIVLYTERIL